LYTHRDGACERIQLHTLTLDEAIFTFHGSPYPLFTAPRRSSSNHDIIEAISLLTHTVPCTSQTRWAEEVQGTGALVLEYEVRGGIFMTDSDLVRNLMIRKCPG
jgi:hypothetical protein